MARPALRRGLPVIRAAAIGVRWGLEAWLIYLVYNETGLATATVLGLLTLWTELHDAEHYG